MNFDPKTHRPFMAYYFGPHAVYVDNYNRLTDVVTFSSKAAQGKCKPHQLDRAPRHDLVPASFAEDLAEAIHHYVHAHDHYVEARKGETNINRLRELKQMMQQALRDLSEARAAYLNRKGRL